MRQHEARALFERLVAPSVDVVDLTRAAIAVAAEEDPEIDVEAEVARLDELGERGLAGVGSWANEETRLKRLGELLFGELGFGGRGCNFEDPRSSFLPAVVARRTGLPITLALVYVHVGRRMGLDCTGVGFPGHFLAKVSTDAGELFIDPFHEGLVLTERDLGERLSKASGGRQKLERHMLASTPPRQILARLLRNLKQLYMRQNDALRAYSAVDRLLYATPDVADDVRDRGLLLAALGAAAPAARDLTRYLQLAPKAADADQVRARLDALGQAKTKTLLN